MFIEEFSNDKDNATKIVLSNLDIDEITADLSIKCIYDEERISLNGITFYGYDFFVDGAEIRYRITDRGLGLVPITFDATVNDYKEKTIKPENVKIIKPN